MNDIPKLKPIDTRCRVSDLPAADRIAAAALKLAKDLNASQEQEDAIVDAMTELVRENQSKKYDFWLQLAILTLLDADKAIEDSDHDCNTDMLDGGCSVCATKKAIANVRSSLKKYLEGANHVEKATENSDGTGRACGVHDDNGQSS